MLTNALWRYAYGPLRRKHPTIGRLLRIAWLACATPPLAVRVFSERLTLRTDPAKVRQRPVLILDLGTHKDAAEMRFAAQALGKLVSAPIRAVGFEASTEFAEAARQDGSEIIHGALCHHVPASGYVTLFHHGESGVAHSLYAAGQKGELVPALRLSNWLRAEFGAQPPPILLRMNIEGAELEVLRDLIETGYASHVAGWFGSWNDVAKRGSGAEAEMRRLCAEHGIRNYPFNARDLRFWPRRLLLAIHLRTSLLKAADQAQKS